MNTSSTHRNLTEAEQVQLALEISKIEDTFRLGALHPIAQSPSSVSTSGLEFFLVKGHRGLDLLVRRFRSMSTLITPLFREDGQELIMLSADQRVPSSVLHPVAITNQFLVFTNKELKTDSIGTGLRQWRYLRCRYVCEQATFPTGNREGRMRRLRTEEIPSGNQASFRPRTLRIPDHDMLLAWMGRTPSSTFTFTFGDAFCGAGGASRGAQLAGLSISWGFDVDGDSGSSYRRNFDRATFHQIDAQQFHIIPQSEVQVDVLHLSPSCQAFSAMNTTPDGGRNGEYNRSSFLSCLSIINRVRPRIVTMEQVPGLLFDRSALYFGNFLRDLVDLGFSVTWALLRADLQGVPQARKRLIIVAGCPGQKLPVLPEATHQSARVNDYLAPADQRTEFEGVWRGTLTTCGALKLDGSRLSERESAAVQSFPRDHVFRGSRTSIRRQIGNAVPPQLARRVFVEVIRCLRDGS